MKPNAKWLSTELEDEKYANASRECVKMRRLPLNEWFKIDEDTHVMRIPDNLLYHIYGKELVIVPQ